MMASPLGISWRSPLLSAAAAEWDNAKIATARQQQSTPGAHSPRIAAIGALSGASSDSARQEPRSEQS
jgi:hypothetical protein